ncbi:hypothetical protein NPIL_489691 [Nephila pilipes]|uniref:Uncharacterized protein n=1 Tax=Nephila pilipes TaxID=299642 RepID=A0A8X6TB71_NEPPI|nr:hypothetical protein NPIL_489691 [Nephila pilipes]
MNIKKCTFLKYGSIPKTALLAAYKIAHKIAISLHTAAQEHILPAAVEHYGVTTEIRKKVTAVSEFAEKYAFLKPSIILSIDDEECNLNQAPQDVDKEFKLEGLRLQAFVAATDLRKNLLILAH